MNSLAWRTSFSALQSGSPNSFETWPTDPPHASSSMRKCQARVQKRSCGASPCFIKRFKASKAGPFCFDATESTNPNVGVTGMSGASALEGGNGTSCAIIEAGSVRCWGSNYYGQLGDGTTTNRLTPVGVTGIRGTTALAAASHTCAIVWGGAVRCWGSNASGQLGADRSGPVFVLTEE